MPEADISFVSSRLAKRLNFVGPAVCALDPTAGSTALPRTRLFRSTLTAANVWGPWCDFLAYMAKHWRSFLSKQTQIAGSAMNLTVNGQARRQNGPHNRSLTRNVRFTPDNGHCLTRVVGPLCARSGHGHP